MYIRFILYHFSSLQVLIYIAFHKPFSSLLYFSISTIYNWGHKDARKEIPEVQHIDGLDIMRPGIPRDTIELIDSQIDIYQQDMDSINNKFLINNGKGKSENRPC